MKGKELKYGILCLGIFVIGGIVGVIFDRMMYSGSSLNLTLYLQNLLNVRLQDYIEEIEGEVRMNGEGEENSSMIKIKVLEEYEETVLEILRDNFWEREPYDGGPSFRKNSLIEEVETKEWKYTFEYMRAGKYAKTKEVFIYVAYNYDRMYVYFWEL